MLFPGRTEPNSRTDAVVVWPHHKADDQAFFCSNLSCLSDDILVRRASSFRHVWLVTDVAAERTWLMRSKQPSCPNCGSPLCATTDDELENEQNAIDYAVAAYLLTNDKPQMAI